MSSQFLLLRMICLLIERNKFHFYIIVPQNCLRVNFTLSYFLRTGSSFSEEWDVGCNVEFTASVSSVCNSFLYDEYLTKCNGTCLLTVQADWFVPSTE
jgi:hypothetical protein